MEEDLLIHPYISIGNIKFGMNEEEVKLLFNNNPLYGSNGKIEKMYSKGSRGSREETYFYENDRLQKIVIRQFDRNDIEQDTLQHSFDYKSNGELKSIILSTELYSETIYQET